MDECKRFAYKLYVAKRQIKYVDEGIVQIKCSSFLLETNMENAELTALQTVKKEYERIRENTKRKPLKSGKR